MNGSTARIAAQAKLNLHLRVLAREQSGFHSIETIFHRIDLADDLVVRITSGERSIDVEGESTGPAESNLAYRAAMAFSQLAGWPRGFQIHLTKQIPVGAGLGGGSADAAAILKVLSCLSPQPIPHTDILRLAATLGADVPFLTSNAVMALAWGRGERMLACSPMPQRDVLLTTPGFGVATADAYRWLDEDRARSAADQPGEPVVVDAGSLTTWEAIAKFARNDFEAPVMARHPELAGYLEQLSKSRTLMARMTGSGSTVFGVVASPSDSTKVPEEQPARVTTTKTSIHVVQPVKVR